VPIAVSGYTQEAGTWKERANGTQGNNRDAAQHAERQMLAQLRRRDGPYLIVQNAFPCHLCHASFLLQSQQCALIVKVTKDEGKYARDHGLGNNPSLPCILYYFRGQMKMVDMTSRGAAAEPPNQFPRVEDFDAIE
jgi:hypothetical protein